MSQIRFTNVVGKTPISVYVADIYGQNRTYLGNITGVDGSPVPPIQKKYPPTLFDNAPAIMVILVDNDGNEKFKIIEGTYGCGFSVVFQLQGCTTELILNPA